MSITEESSASKSEDESSSDPSIKSEGNLSKSSGKWQDEPKSIKSGQVENLPTMIKETHSNDGDLLTDEIRIEPPAFNRESDMLKYKRELKFNQNLFDE